MRKRTKQKSYHSRGISMRVIIIGAGASGLACGIRIKQGLPDAQITVLEHLDAPCKKILATGNGRCNLTNTNAPHYKITRDFFESLGLVMREETEGRVYPYSNQASTVADLLSDECKRLGIEIVTSCDVYRTEKYANKYNAYTDKGIFMAEYMVLATGGMSQKGLGSDGSGYKIAKKFSHTVTPLHPALVQLKSPGKYCHILKGLRTKCNIKIEINGEILREEYGELLFTDYGISGIAVMNLSEYVNDDLIKSGEEKCTAVIDFIPDMSKTEIAEHYSKYGSLKGILPGKLCAVLNKQSGGNGEKAAAYAKNWRLIINGTKGFDFAQITKGGVRLTELNGDFESALNENLYIVGELTDNQFFCGGYNLDFAFSSGVIAANSIISKEENRYNDKNKRN